ncbi:hypothetical protein B0J11DRAFT_506040 [Dendryphion nanum]|uniref:Uncharacterized protein n=1 Tax=Dendryphion nanum TaxID=256645 RepID=A0A9P9IK44_9PLEO|nr:hypothetical protein B0J11DRAFT_506040 [Dendryphion nanum]
MAVTILPAQRDINLRYDSVSCLVAPTLVADEEGRGVEAEWRWRGRRGAGGASGPLRCGWVRCGARREMTRGSSHVSTDKGKIDKKKCVLGSQPVRVHMCVSLQMVAGVLSVGIVGCLYHMDHHTQCVSDEHRARTLSKQNIMPPMCILLHPVASVAGAYLHTIISRPNNGSSLPRRRCPSLVLAAWRSGGGRGPWLEVEWTVG